MNHDNEQALATLAERLADGYPVDWEKTGCGRAGSDPRLEQLKLLEKVLIAHRALSDTSAPDDDTAAVHANSVTAPNDGPPDPLTWGPMRDLARIGEGSFGEVYRAFDSSLQTWVALKLLRASKARDAAGEERFLAEARRLARVRHRNVVVVHGADRHAGRVGFWSELLQGETLEAVLEHQGRFGASEATAIGLDLCRALAAVHAAGVVHRDVKASNVMREEGGRIVLMDLGSGGEMPEEGQTSYGESLYGTPLAMAPEQLHGQVAGPATDIYGLGALLYRLVSGRHPIEAASLYELVEMHRAGGAAPLRDVRPDLSRDFIQVVERAIEPEPTRRFPSAGTMERALEAILGGTGLAGVPPASLSSAPTPPALPAPSERTHGGGRRRLLVAIAVVAGLVLVTVAAMWWATVGRRERALAPSPASAHGRAEIAVLPFQNLSPVGANAYFAGGLHDELLTQLAKVASLKVISRTSVMGYATTTKPLKQIAAELGVGSIVEGSVQVAGSRLRVNVQLIDAATDEHLWAERYDRTLDDAFAIQSEVAHNIVDAVGGALTTAEGERIAAPPTANAEAYRLYLRAQEYHHRPGDLRQNFENAEQLYEKALALDPGFALAHAGLSVEHGRMYWLKYDPSPERVARQRSEAEVALSLAPELPQAHLAMGLAYYWGRRDYAPALAEFSIAVRGLPNDAEAWTVIGYVHRRLGNWSKVYETYERVTRLDPRNAKLFYDLGASTFQLTRRYADAARADEQALFLAPNLRGAAVQKGWTYVLWRGNLDTLRAVLNPLPPDAPLGDLGDARAQRAKLLLWERRTDSLLALMASGPERVLEGQHFFLPTALYSAWAYQVAGDRPAARASFRSALVPLDSAIVDLGDDWRVHAARGLSLAGLGRRAAALAETRWLEHSTIYLKDAAGARVAEARAQILAQAGDADAALDEIERLLAGPSWLSVHTLRLDPRWDPIREHPRFKALLVKYANTEKWGVR